MCAEGKDGKEINELICKEIISKQMPGATVDQKARALADMKQKAMVVGNNPQGGYWVLPEMANFVSKRQFETSPIRQVANE